MFVLPGGYIFSFQFNSFDGLAKKLERIEKINTQALYCGTHYAIKNV